MPKDNKLCPLKGFKPCMLQECAWYYANECAVASVGFVDHTLRETYGLSVVKKPESKEGGINSVLD